MSKSQWIEYSEKLIESAPEEPGIFELGNPEHVEYIGCAPGSLNASLFCFKKNVAGIGTDKCHMFRWLTTADPKVTWHQALDFYRGQHNNDYPPINERQMTRKKQMGQDPDDPMP